MTRTCYAGLYYEEKDRDLWRIYDLDKQVAVGPQYKSRAELLADLDRFARAYGAAHIGPTLCFTLDDYRNAPGGVGPLAAQWKDKPHRLVYDLCAVLEQARILT